MSFNIALPPLILLYTTLANGIILRCKAETKLTNTNTNPFTNWFSHLFALIFQVEIFRALFQLNYFNSVSLLICATPKAFRESQYKNRILFILLMATPLADEARREPLHEYCSNSTENIQIVLYKVSSAEWNAELEMAVTANTVSSFSVKNEMKNRGQSHCHHTENNNINDLDIYETSTRHFTFSVFRNPQFLQPSHFVPRVFRTISFNSKVH